MIKTRIEKRGTRDWVLFEDNLDTGDSILLREFITKREALKYLAKRKKLKVN